MAAARIYQGKWVLVKLPLAVLALAAMAWLWFACWPLPPSELTISSGLPEGVYHQYAQRYSEIFAREGIGLDVAASEGSETNLQRLRGLAQPRADLAFVQGGLGFDPGERSAGARIETIARVDTEPLWIFARSPLDSLEQLRNLRVSLGPKGSGTRKLALALLRQVRMDAGDLIETDVSGLPAAQALQQGALDVLLMVSAPQSPVVRELLRSPGVALVQLKRSTALIERLPYLQLRLLPRGSIDPAARLPARDVALLVTTTSLVARADLHPALQRLAAEVAREVHSGPSPFHRAGDFPALRRIEFPASAEARRTLLSGRPWLEEQLPFWQAQVALRVLVICLPIALVAWWLAHTIPAYLRWLLESRIARWYGELKFIEHDLANQSMSGMERIRSLQRLETIEKNMRDFPTPPDLMARWFTLREHVEFVRARLYRGKGR
ncbi:MAG TPA: TAXI family TRAP transporter solute-binding subunit [Ramlibacter sp.]|nr:TAXI family TRAP transporter solute-binding subunit [Ramlibacter sp.]